MKYIIVLFIIFSLVLMGAESALAHTEDDSLNYDYNFNEDFNEDNWFESWNNVRGGRNNIDIVKGFEGLGLEVSIFPRDHFGSEFSYIFIPEIEELYFRYFLRFDKNWDTYGSGGKIPGPVGIYSNTALGCKPSTINQPGWSARMMWFGNNQESKEYTQIGYYAYHLDQPRDCGEAMKWNEYGELKNGTWYCIEGYIKLNTSGKRNGILRGWVNGQEAFTKTNLAFRREAEKSINIRKFWFNVYFGGKNVPPKEQSVTFDNIALTNYRIGCAEFGFLLRTWQAYRPF